MAALPAAPERIDPRAVCERVDLLELLGRDTQLKRVASTRGGEYAGPCPLCGGTDRLRVHPFWERPEWWCRHCCDEGKWDDAIGYVRRRDGVGFRDAVQRLVGGAALDARPRPARPVPVEDDPEPSPVWRQRAEAFVAWAEDQLWRPEGAWARRYLTEWRGLDEATLHRFRVGWNPRDLRDAPARWGSDRPEPVALAAGIVLPWIIEGRIDQVKIRRLRTDAPSWAESDAVGEPKYLSVAGGVPVLYGADTLPGQSAAFMVEGEFDALLTWQEVGDLAGVVTLGGCAKGLSTAAILLLLPVRELLVAYDRDAAGEAGAAKLLARSGRMRPVVVPDGKDVTEYHRAGGDVRAWAAGAVFAESRALSPAEVAEIEAMPIVRFDRETGDAYEVGVLGSGLPEVCAYGHERDAYGPDGTPLCAERGCPAYAGEELPW
jgi:DNA primase